MWGEGKGVGSSFGDSIGGGGESGRTEEGIQEKRNSGVVVGGRRGALEKKRHGEVNL